MLLQRAGKYYLTGGISWMLKRALAALPCALSRQDAI
jgi:hypothetical protein